MTEIPRLLETYVACHQRGDFAGARQAIQQVIALDPAGFASAAETFVRSFPREQRGHFWAPPPGFYPERSDLKAVFEFIYGRGVWSGGSGPGSDLANTVAYVGYVQTLIGRPDVRSVLDLGCGDWRFSRYLDLAGRAYLGLDVVPSVIAADTAAYGTDSIRFREADLTGPEPLPDCDLILCKDVLQHLSNRNVRRVLDKCGRARLVLITNDYHPDNLDCGDGDTRPLDPTKSPFGFPARPVLQFGMKVSFLADRSAG